VDHRRNIVTLKTSLQAGHKLAHYEILDLIGRGGMGEVYRAKDSKLGRDVAIKVLPDEFAQDEERLRRFQREAKVLASLNHQNIASIYGLEQWSPQPARSSLSAEGEAEGVGPHGTERSDTHYVVLELVPGETLADRIGRAEHDSDPVRALVEFLKATGKLPPHGGSPQHQRQLFPDKSTNPRKGAL
jgi:serine/threonine protein kinase